MKITLDKEELQEIAKIREELKKAKLNAVYRGVYQNTILDWQPDETYGYPEGTNIYVKEGERWVPYTGIFFKEEHFLYKGKEVSFVETFLQNEEITKITIYQIIKNKKLIGYVNESKKSVICY